MTAAVKESVAMVVGRTNDQRAALIVPSATNEYQREAQPIVYAMASKDARIIGRALIQMANEIDGR